MPGILALCKKPAMSVRAQLSPKMSLPSWRPTLVGGAPPNLSARLCCQTTRAKMAFQPVKNAWTWATVAPSSSAWMCKNAQTEQLPSSTTVSAAQPVPLSTTAHWCCASPTPTRCSAPPAKLLSRIQRCAAQPALTIAHWSTVSKSTNALMAMCHNYCPASAALLALMLAVTPSARPRAASLAPSLSQYPRPQELSPLAARNLFATSVALWIAFKISTK